MLHAALFAGLATFGLILGFIINQSLHPGSRIVGMTMALGAGLLISVVSYSLVLESFDASGRPLTVGVGIAAGSIVYFLADRGLDERFGGSNANSGISVALGAVLDGIPESLVIGISAALTGKVSIPLVIAAAIANMGESLSATHELEGGGLRPRIALSIWVAIATGSVLSAIFGYAVVSEIGTWGGVIVNGFAAGAVLMVLSNALIPDGYKFAGREAGLLVVLGFSIGFALEHL